MANISHVTTTVYTLQKTTGRPTCCWRPTSIATEFYAIYEVGPGLKSISLDFPTSFFMQVEISQLHPALGKFTSCMTSHVFTLTLSVIVPVKVNLSEHTCRDRIDFFSQNTMCSSGKVHLQRGQTF